MIDIKVKKLTKSARIPTRAYEHDAGWDLYVNKLKYNGYQYTIHFGIALEIPEGYVGLIFPRSSIFKNKLRLSNSVGVIDSGYRGEIKAVFDIKDLEGEFYKLDDKAAQIIFIKIPDIAFSLVDELSESDRAEGGYGSSGK